MGCSASATRCTPTSGRRLKKVTLTRRPGETVGLRLQRFSHGVVICGVEEGGLVEQWNSRYPARAIGAGDWLLSANGVLADGSWGSWCDILGQLRSTGIELTVTRELQLYNAIRQTLSTPKIVDQLLPEGFMDELPRLLAAEGESLECSICLEDSKPDEIFVQLPCKHAFHMDCAERWLSQCPTMNWAKCPTCRQQIYKGPEMAEAPAAELQAAEPEADPAVPGPAAVGSSDAEPCCTQCSRPGLQQEGMRIKMSL